MVSDPRYGPDAQTPEQRTRVLHQLQAVHPRLSTHATAHARQLYARYVAGELVWAEVRHLLDLAG